MTHSAAYLAVRHDVFRICTFVTVNALLANFLPRSSSIRNVKVRRVYCGVIDLIAGFGLSWRAERPSLQQEWMGFKAKRRARTMIVELRLAPEDNE